jgi:uncharacterized membrane protein
MVDASTTSSALKSGNLVQGLGLGGFNLGGGTLGTIFLWIFISLLFVGIIVGIVILVVYKRTYSQNIHIYKMLGNKPTLALIDKARIMRMGAVGDTLFQLRKMKKFIAPPTIQISPNTWWYWQRGADSELINFTLGDVDEQMRKAGVKYVDTDKRMQRLGIEKNLRDRFEKIGFWAKYGATIMGIVFVIMVTIALVVLFSKLVDVAKAMESTAGAITKMAESVDKFYMNTQGGGTSGLIPAEVVKT